VESRLVISEKLLATNASNLSLRSSSRPQDGKEMQRDAKRCKQSLRPKLEPKNSKNCGECIQVHFTVAAVRSILRGKLRMEIANFPYTQRLI
jgi:hypothetical protein